MPDLAPSDLTQPLTAAEEFADVLDDLRQLSTGMLATQLRKASEGLGEWQAAWRAGDARVLRGAQRVKLAAALQALKAKVAELEGELEIGG